MLYFNQKEYFPENTEEVEQVAYILDLKRVFQKKFYHGIIVE
jgi:hypothetical protein